MSAKFVWSSTKPLISSVNNVTKIFVEDNEEKTVRSKKINWKPLNR